MSGIKRWRCWNPVLTAPPGTYVTPNAYTGLSSSDHGKRAFPAPPSLLPGNFSDERQQIGRSKTSISADFSAKAVDQAVLLPAANSISGWKTCSRSVSKHSKLGIGERLPACFPPSASHTEAKPLHHFPFDAPVNAPKKHENLCAEKQHAQPTVLNVCSISVLLPLTNKRPLIISDRLVATRRGLVCNAKGWRRRPIPNALRKIGGTVGGLRARIDMRVPLQFGET